MGGGLPGFGGFGHAAIREIARGLEVRGFRLAYRFGGSGGKRRRAKGSEGTTQTNKVCFPGVRVGSCVFHSRSRTQSGGLCARGRACARARFSTLSLTLFLRFPPNVSLPFAGFLKGLKRFSLFP